MTSIRNTGRTRSTQRTTQASRPEAPASPAATTPSRPAERSRSPASAAVQNARRTVAREAERLAVTLNQAARSVGNSLADVGRAADLRRDATPDINGRVDRNPPSNSFMAQAWERARAIIGPLARGRGGAQTSPSAPPRPAVRTSQATPGTTGTPPTTDAERDAIRRGNAILRGFGNEGNAAQGITVERNPLEANHADPRLQERATAELERNAPLEREQLAQLSPADQRRFQDVAQAVQHDPASRLSLQMMLFDGRVPGSDRNHDGRVLLDELHRSTTQPTAGGIERNRMVADMVQEIYDPASIAQKGRGTCAATSAMIATARDDPAEYARLVNGLASPEGRVHLRNGDLIGREAGTHQDDGTGRTVSERLLASSLMEYADPTQRYDNATDRHADGSAGLSVTEANRVIEGLSGRDFNARAAANDSEAEALLQEIDRAVDRGEPVLAGLDWGNSDDGMFHGRHKLMVSRVTDSRVWYVNPWGQLESMARDEFTRRLNNANIPAPAVS